jgi:hypothetical protein
VNRARLAALEGRKIDALTYYQKGLGTREPLQARRGKLKDDVTDEARVLWKETANRAGQAAKRRIAAGTRTGEHPRLQFGAAQPA